MRERMNVVQFLHSLRSYERFPNVCHKSIKFINIHARQNQRSTIWTQTIQVEFPLKSNDRLNKHNRVNDRIVQEHKIIIIDVECRSIIIFCVLSIPCRNTINEEKEKTSSNMDITSLICEARTSNIMPYKCTLFRFYFYNLRIHHKVILLCKIYVFDQ